MTKKSIISLEKYSARYKKLDTIAYVHFRKKKYCTLLCIMCSHVYCTPTFLAQIFRKNLKISHFNFVIQLFVYLYLETKPITVFQGIIFHTDIIIAF